MPDRLIVNASPLIFLWRVDGLGWLTALSRNKVLVPEAVVSEVLSGPDGDAIMDMVKRNDQFTVADDAMPPAFISAWDLGAGETQVLAVSLRRPGSVTVLDDKAGRRCGLSLGRRVGRSWGVIHSDLDF
jgi:predicted nucleic acid-binding protein